MPSKEIKELRQSGKLDEAYAMAKAELAVEPENIWGKRNLSWVLYSQLDASASDLSVFLQKIEELKQLALPSTEEMFFENLSIVLSKAARSISKEGTVDQQKLFLLFDAIKELPLRRNTKWFSVLFSAFHKAMRDSVRYVEFADWWNFENFKLEDFQKQKLPNGKEVMSIAEQGYIAYAKHLLPRHTPFGEEIFDREKAGRFLPILSAVAETYPQMQFPVYFVAKLMIALGSKDNMLDSLLPFARKKRGEFWVWQVLAEAFSDDHEKVFACYCKALSCKSPEEMLVGLRQKTAAILISKNLYNEARTEIDLLVKARTEHEFKIPSEVTAWQLQEWYKNAKPSKSNGEFYGQYTFIADSLLFTDTPEESVIVEFVNSDKKILNFIASESKFGFFKYDRFLKDVKIGDVLKVRFQSGTQEGIYLVYTVAKSEDESFRNLYLKAIEGAVKIPAGKPFGFLDQAFIHPALVSKMKLTDGLHIKASAIKTYNQERKQWGWKLI